MPANNLRQTQSEGEVYINKWWSGVYPNRSPLFTPTSLMGIQMINREDTLWDGLNFEISRKMTMQRRFGFLRYCSTQFGGSDFPLAFYSFRNLAGTVKAMVDTPTHLYWFNTTSITSVFAKNTTAQGSMVKVTNTLYYCDGNDLDKKKWDGTTVSLIGITTPVTAPTLTFAIGSLTPLSGYQYGYCFKNSTTGHVSTMSPVSANTGSQTNQEFTVMGDASTDPQVDKIQIYRTADGGGTFYLLTTIANVANWSFTDQTPDTSLNTFIVAPVADANDPPPAGISKLVWHSGRLWAATGSVLYFSAGPDCTNGVGTEAWPPANNFPVPGQITGLVSTSQGLLVFTSDDMYVVYGQNSTTFTVPQLLQQNFGVQSQNNIAQDGDLIFVFTNKSQLFQIPVGGVMSEIGFPIATPTLLGAMNAANVYLALHRSGSDEGLFVSDGATNMWRYSISMSCWSPVAQPVGGVKCIASIEATTANWVLFQGKTTGSNFILARDLNTFTDDGTAYTGFFTVGSLLVAPPFHTAKIGSVLLQVQAVGTYPTVSVLVNEVSDTGVFPATFVVLPNPQPDPPQVVPASVTILAKRHDFARALGALSQNVQHMQVKVSIIAEAAQNEILGLAIAPQAGR